MTTTTLLTPARVARLLGVSQRYVYQHFPLAEYGRGSVPVSAVLSFLNERRTGTMPELKELVALVDEAEVAPLVSVDGHPATLPQIRGFARRKVYPVPAFILSGRIVRFPRGAVEWWLSYIDSAVPVRFRLYHIGAPARTSTFRTNGVGSGRVRAASRA